jgi:hypothetical protein
VPEHPSSVGAVLQRGEAEAGGESSPRSVLSPLPLPQRHRFVESREGCLQGGHNRALLQAQLPLRGFDPEGPQKKNVLSVLGVFKKVARIFQTPQTTMDTNLQLVGILAANPCTDWRHFVTKALALEFLARFLGRSAQSSGGDAERRRCDPADVSFAGESN